MDQKLPRPDYTFFNEDGIIYWGNEKDISSVSLFANNVFNPGPRWVIQKSKLQILDKIEARDLRVYSKRTIVILEALQKIRFDRIKNNFDSSKIGVYAAGPDKIFNSDALKFFLESESIFQLSKKHSPPKFGFYSQLCYIPAHVSIFYRLQGPTNAFIGTHHSLKHAFSQALNDLTDNEIDLAIVSGSYTLEDELTIYLESAKLKNIAPVESVVVCLITQKNMDFYSEFVKCKLDQNCDSQFGFNKYFLNYLQSTNKI